MGSGESGERVDSCERVIEILLPGSAGGHPECPLPGGACQPSGDPEQPVAAGDGGAGAVVGQADQAGPPSEVVREGGDHGPGAVGGELSGGEMAQGLVFEITDREFDDGVLSMLGFDEQQRLGAVGREREVLPVGEQVGLLADEACAARDQPPTMELGLAICASPSWG